MGNHNLIEKIAHNLKVSYISDIKCKKYYMNIHQFLIHAKADDYSIDQWRDLASYFEIEVSGLVNCEDIKRAAELFFKSK